MSTFPHLSFCYVVQGFLQADHPDIAAGDYNTVGYVPAVPDPLGIACCCDVGDFNLDNSMMGRDMHYA